MKKNAINTSLAPAAVGPYSQAIKTSGEFLFLSGQIAFNPLNNKFDQNLSLEAQAKQVMKNLTAVLNEAGLNWENVVKTEIFLVDMNDFAAVNEIYGNWIQGIIPPARQCVEVSKLPLNAKIEISCVAVFN